MGQYCKRLIEVDLPIRRISEHARREKSIRHGHISTLHIWWARRPLAACRAVICAALWPDPGDQKCPKRFKTEAARLMKEFRDKRGGKQRNWDHGIELRQALLDFIADFANWDNSTVRDFLETSRALTQIAHETLSGEVGTRPLVVDPFAGGGAIPLEALRIGADVFASDINPIPVILNKVILEYIPKYGNELTEGIKKTSKLISKEAKNILSNFYPKDKDGLFPVAYLWARTIKCEGPNCGIEVPLLRSLWLSKKQSIGLRLINDESTKSIRFEISSQVNAKEMDNGTILRGNAVCPFCNFTTQRSSVEAQIKKGFTESRMLVVVVNNKYAGKKYRLPNKKDLDAVNKASVLIKSNEISEILPNENLPYLRSIFNVHVYGIDKWEKLFDARQKFAIATYVKIVKRLYNESFSNNKELGKAICTCIGIAIDRLADFNSNISRWANHRETSAATFARQALGMVWDYCETVPISESTGSFSGSIEWIVRVCENLSHCKLHPGNAEQSSAVEHNLPDNICSLLFTDPPYYDAIPYANLSDFFYVWMKRSIGQVHPTIFSEMETPKNEEIIQLSERNPIYGYKTKEYYETLMAKSFVEGLRYTKQTGLAVIVFAHKTTSAWESLLSALVTSGWTITASWPLDTEMSSRMRANNSAVLTSSIHLVCRPRENLNIYAATDNVGDWRDVLNELPESIHNWLPRIASEGIVGADAIFACLGPALEIYSRYSSVEKASGKKVELKEYLEHVWAAVSREALNMIFEDADASGFEEDARLTAMWLWTLRTGVENGKDIENEDSNTKPVPECLYRGNISGYSLEYDAARKIAQGLGAHLEKLGHLVETKGDTAILLSAAARTRYLFGKDAGEAPKKSAKKKNLQLKFDLEDELKEVKEDSKKSTGDFAINAGSTVLDQLHQSMILFGTGRGEAVKRLLMEEGVGSNPLFWRLAQALSALYPSGTDEKRWVDGVLARKKGLGF